MKASKVGLGAGLVHGLNDKLVMSSGKEVGFELELVRFILAPKARAARANGQPQLVTEALLGRINRTLAARGE